VDEGSVRQSGFRRRIIERPRLTQLLTESESRVILLVAPAGFGKTTLAREWLRDKPSHAWYQATEASSDAAGLAVGIATSASTIVPHAGEQLRGRLKTEVDPAAQATSLAADLATDLADWPTDTWFVIDDYHLLAESHAAEKFVETLVAETAIPFLIASRTRPSWVTAKRLLYGEVAEFGRTVLAMTHSEAAQALPEAYEEMPGLVALAEGWPAVIGLAALVPTPLPSEDREIPETLHDYFAEELYHGLSNELRWNLAQLSLAQSLHDRLGRALFGACATEVFEGGHRSGFLSKQFASYEMHPLLRRFLRAKLSEFDRAEIERTASVIGDWYAGEARWDEAASLAEEFRLVELTLRILQEALDSVLSDGRLTTVNRWLESAQAMAPTAPIVRLASVEVMFRTQDWVHAGPRASQLAHSIEDEDTVAARAYLRAGQIAHLDDRLHEALELFTAARATARTPSDLRRSVWSRFLTLTDLEERERAAEALQELDELPPLGPDDLLRDHQGHLHFAIRWGGLTEALERLPDVIELVNRSSDPIVRTGFLQTYGAALNLSAGYEESLEIARRQLEEAQQFKLAWVIPHALEMQAISQVGLREFDAALTTFSRTARLAKEQGSVHTQMNAGVLTARVHLARGAPERAVRLLEQLEPRATSPGMEGDFLATHGFALACCGRTAEARELLEASEAVTTHLEARVLREFSRAVASSFDRSDATVNKEMLIQALMATRDTGNFDAFLCAYRAFPMLLQSLLHLDGVDARPFTRLVRTHDRGLADTFGLKPPAREERDDAESLTPRERDVLELVRQGLTNREIARTLWIAESTVKVHIHHVLAKLGARSRTEAAMMTLSDS
jgi:LuxR family maltose regulon positive regulatory protein